MFKNFEELKRDALTHTNEEGLMDFIMNNEPYKSQIDAWEADADAYLIEEMMEMGEYV